MAVPIALAGRRKLRKYKIHQILPALWNAEPIPPGQILSKTTFFTIPCLTLRPNTERPITITQGTNKLTSLPTLDQDLEHLLNGHHPGGRIPELWDGLTGQRIIQVLLGHNTHA